MKFSPTLCLGLASLGATTLNAVIAITPTQMTPIQTGTYEGTSDGTYTDFGGGISYLGGDALISGFKKFDSSLGTLTGIRVTLSFSATASTDLDVYAEGSDVPAEDEYFYASFSSYAQVDIIYRPGGGDSGISVLTNGFGVTGGYVEGLAGDYTYYDGDYPFLSAYDGSYDEDGQSDIPNEFDPNSDPFFSLSDFLV